MVVAGTAGYLTSEYLPCFTATPSDGAPPACATAASGTAAGSSSAPCGPAEGNKSQVMSRRGGRLFDAFLLFIELCFLTAMPRAVDGGVFSLSPPQSRLSTAISVPGLWSGSEARRKGGPGPV
jgi:hypothetical protein